jgi:DNA modification methylase
VICGEIGASADREEGMTSTPSGVETLPLKVKEQLQLFPSHNSSVSHLTDKTRKHHEWSKQQRLGVLLRDELNFHGADSSYASHDVHAFAAKFPPQLPRAFIRGLTAPGDVVLDPMMGSGTSIVEALLEGRCGIGLDIDPLALRVSQAKTMLLSMDELRDIGRSTVSQAQQFLARKKVEKFLQKFDSRTKEFIDYWFYPHTQRELAALVLAMQTVQASPVRRFLELTFSAIIVTKSGGVSRARDLAHSRPHLDKAKHPKNALEQFSRRLQKNTKSMAYLDAKSTLAASLTGDARSMPLRDEVIDLIVTSPPYANAIDYMRAHKFSLVWLREPVVNLTELRARYIGSEKLNGTQYAELPDKTASIVRQLEARDRRKSSILRKYFTEMRAVLAEMYRVLRQDAPAIIVVGPSIMRGIDVQTHHCLAEMAQETGFSVIGVVQRSLDRNKRMMPARFGKKTDTMIERRMHEEYVIGLLKPSADQSMCCGIKPNPLCPSRSAPASCGLQS